MAAVDAFWLALALAGPGNAVLRRCLGKWLRCDKPGLSASGQIPGWRV